MQSSCGRLVSFVVCLMVLGVFGLGSVGCSSGYKKFDVAVALEPASMGQDSPVTVDIVALGGERAEDLEGMPVRKYWTRNDPYRQGLIDEGVLWTTELTAGDPAAMLSVRDGIWNSPVWRSGGKLFILAEIRGVGPGPNGDPRRRALPRDAALWDQSVLDVTVKPSGVSYSPTEKSVGR